MKRKKRETKGISCKFTADAGALAETQFLACHRLTSIFNYDHLIKIRITFGGLEELMEKTLHE